MNAAVVVETMRRHFTSIGFITYLILIAMTGLFVATFNTPASIWPALVTILSIITGAAIIGPEFSTARLQLIVSRPIRRSVYLLSRVTGVLASVAVAASVGITSEIVARLLLRSAAVPWLPLASAYASSLLVSLLAISLLTMLGSLTSAYFNVAIYAGVQVALSAVETLLGLLRTRPNSLSEFLHSHQQLEKGLIALDDLLFPAPPPHPDTGWLLRVVATAAAALPSHSSAARCRAAGIRPAPRAKSHAAYPGHFAGLNGVIRRGQAFDHRRGFRRRRWTRLKTVLNLRHLRIVYLSPAGLTFGFRQTTGSAASNVFKCASRRARTSDGVPEESRARRSQARRSWSALVAEFSANRNASGRSGIEGQSADDADVRRYYSLNLRPSA